MNASGIIRASLALAVTLFLITLTARGREQPASPADRPAEATIRVIVSANAEVFFDGNPTTQKGTERLFFTPPLTVGKQFHYNVLVRWKDNGKTVEQTRKVNVAAESRFESIL